MEQEKFRLLEEYKFKTASEAFTKAEDVISKRKDGLLKPLKSKWSKFNKIIGGGLQPATTYVIGGRPGVGKSTFSNRLIFDICDTTVEKIIILYWTWEMPDYQQIIRALSYDLNLSVQDILSSERPLEEEYFQTIKDLKTLYTKYPVYFSNKSVSPQTIKSINQEMYLKLPDTKIINILDHTRLIKSKTKASEEERITALLSTFADCATQFETINIVLSQLNRSIESQERIKKPIPQLSDFFGADAVGQFGNVCVILQRPEMYNIKEYLGEDFVENLLAVHLLKNRDGDVGWIPFEHKLKFNTLKER